jgi:hypothetical protein
MIRRRRSFLRSWLALLGWCLVWAPCFAALAAISDPVAAPGELHDDRTRAAAAVGSFVALSQRASLVDQQAVALGLGGYDTARAASSFETAAELRVIGPVAVRVGAVYVPSAERMRPSAGAKVQILRASAHRVDAAVGVSYRPEGLTEPEGEIESLVSVGYPLERAYLLANVLYGQDPEGRERDGEVRAAALRLVGNRFVLGVDGRFRFDLGSTPAKLATENVFDLLIGPTAAFATGPVMLLAQGGASLVRRTQEPDALGAFALMGVGGAF